MLVTEYSEGFFAYDSEMRKLTAEDNLNATVCSSQDEMTMCSKIARIMTTSKDIFDSGGKHYDGNKILLLVNLEGNDNFSADSIQCFIEFNCTLCPLVFKVFQTLHFAMIKGRARLSPKDYRAVAKMD